MPKLTWTDADEIGFQLHDRLPAVDPLTVRFTDLITQVLELPDFEGSPTQSSEKLLEAIQMSWLDYYRE